MSIDSGWRGQSLRGDYQRKGHRAKVSLWFRAAGKPGNASIESANPSA